MSIIAIDKNENGELSFGLEITTMQKQNVGCVKAMTFSNKNNGLRVINLVAHNL